MLPGDINRKVQKKNYTRLLWDSNKSVSKHDLTQPVCLKPHTLEIFKMK